MNVTGAEEVKGFLDLLNVKVAKSILRKGLRAGAKTLVASARSEAPKLTGALKRNIKIRGGIRVPKGSVSMSVGVGAKDFTGKTFYAAFVLWGHKVGSKKLGDARKQVAANEFLDRAYDATNQTVVTVATDKWMELIRKEVAA